MPAEPDLAIRAWNMLGGLDWSGLEIVADVLGFDDLEGLIVQLQTINNFRADEN